MEFDIVFWNWWALAIVFLVIELLAPGFYFLWMAASAFVTGGLLLMMSFLSTQIQISIFSILAIGAISAWKIYGKKYPTTTDQPLLNRRGSQYIGRVFSLYQPIINGEGKIKVDDSIWKVYGKDCDINSKVKVIANRGTVFDVERADY